MPPPLFVRSTAPPPDCGEKRRQPSLLESGRDEFPGRGTLLLKVPDCPVERFIAPSRCAEVESEKRRHPEADASEFAGLATQSAFTLELGAPETPGRPRIPRNGLVKPEFRLDPSIRENP